MDPSVFFFLTSGLFLGWALGANDAANVFGTAVGTRMLQWSTAAVICSVFVVLGAVMAGSGPSQTVGKLGTITQLPGAFMVALSAALAVYVMTKLGITVSTTQAIIGGIVGWNLFAAAPTDSRTLSTIVSTWVICPFLSAGIAIILYKVLTWALRVSRLHLFRVDAYNRIALVIAGAFGAYALGANNIANVVGVFIPAKPFPDLVLENGMTISSNTQLFLLGGIAIAVGVLTYSRGVMMTVGSALGRISPIAAFAAVIAHSIVLIIFASRDLEAWLAAQGLPTIPLVPVSSSQAVVGAVVGIGILKGVAGIRWHILGSIVIGWLATPVMAGVISFIGLYFLQNVFDQVVK